ncbi:peptidase C65 Otubain-domain-containing protein [Xylaria cf. heliscus]|nr:peptidase C65 Otubain-domain-containing protein [Xylaria cf. heliscus]
MVVGSKLARQEQDSTSRSGSPARGTDNNSCSSSSIADPSISISIGTGTGTGIGSGSGAGSGAGIGAGIGILGLGMGMFQQPQPTSYLPFSLYPEGLHVANAGLPQYTFASTPLFEQFVGGHVGASSAGSSDGAVVGGRSGPSPAGTFPVATNSNFHGSASASGGPAGMGAGVQPVQPVQPVQGLGPPTTVAASDNSAGYSSSSAGSLHPGLYNIPMPVSVPRHHLSQHRQPQHQNQPPPPPPPQQQQQQQHQHQQHQHRHLPQRPLHLSDRTTIHYKMEQSLGLDQNEIAQQEAAARDFEPQLKGPLVGEKVSSQAITEEYARADPVYVAKTMALPQTYSHYRPMQGDGNCGWRAIAFSYFETLVKCGNINLVQSELHRMTGLNKYVEEFTGGDPTILELMMEATLLLFNDIIADMSERNDPMPNLFAKFNDPQTSNCLVYHLRLLASARLKANSAQYEPYLDDTIQNYIDKTVMPVNREIDHICVVAVHDILLRPTNMVLDIAYLDRSEGTEVNVHRFPEEANGQDPSTLGPIIYLLYRPDHYDILYRDTQVHISPVPAVPAPVDLQINRVNEFVPHNADFEEPVAAMQDASYTMDMSALAMIPGLSSTLSPPPMTDPYASSPASSWVSHHFTPEIISPPPPSQPSPPQQQATVHQLRFSKYNFPNLHEMATESGSAHEPPFTTNTFKNSHFNTAHYNNLNFQPEMYQPDAEEEAPSNGHSKIGGRKRSTEHCPGIKKEK